MELSQFPQAIERFNTVLTSNAATGDNYFQDEAEYYLALAYIASKQPGEADVLLKRISASNNHVYQQKARNMLGLDWKIIRAQELSSFLLFQFLLLERKKSDQHGARREHQPYHRAVTVFKGIFSNLRSVSGVPSSRESC